MTPPSRALLAAGLTAYLLVAVYLAHAPLLTGVAELTTSTGCPVCRACSRAR